jgi:hypothetical protein
MKRQRKRKCLHCGKLFRSGPRNLHHQRKYLHHLFPLTVRPLAQEPHLDDTDDSTLDALQDLDDPPF